MAAAALLSTGGPPNPTASEVLTTASSIQRTWDQPAQQIHRSILGMLDGAVTDRETESILDQLGRTAPGQFMAIMDRLRQEPWKQNKNLLHKFMRRGVQDDQAFITGFARIAARQLGLDLHPAVAQGMRKHARQHALADAAEALLDFFECEPHANFGMDEVNAMERVGEDVANTAFIFGVLIYGLLGGTLPAPS